MPIKVYKSNQADAPILNGNSASLITVLDAVLVNGYNTLSVTGITRSGTTATVTTASAHDFVSNDWVTVSGATETDYNGSVFVTVVNSTTFTYTVSGSPATPATGTITCKRSSGGFSKVFSATGKAVYRADRMDSARHYLRVLDNSSTASGYREAATWSWEGMSDVDTGSSGPTPNARYCAKSSTSDATAKNWILITDGKLIYFVANTDNSTYFHAFVWGDFLSNKAGDTYNVVHIGGATGGQSQTTAPQNAMAKQTSSINGVDEVVLARSFTAVSAQVSTAALIASGLSANMSSNYLTYPHAVDNGLDITPININEGSTAVLRGRLPGAYESMHGRCLPNQSIFDNVQNLTGRNFIMVYTTTSSVGCSFVLDITGNNHEWD